ncbi:UPF0158 family protein [Cohnella fermenti]|uniref:Uncharacterized protein n=1 Tax=Cohnella fermenti TaxID=2565925 RepID=A0A4S4BMG3_9BACL|nr:UPF0158 family protein [Cohnella fermenti]THF73605.1 hypothetical protein E6C55_28390 [Cohnella fermenti]
MKEMRLTGEQLGMIVASYDMHFDELDDFLNIETGEVVSLRMDHRDEEEEELSEIIEEGFGEVYFRVPKRESSEGYNDMEEFADTVADRRLQSALFRALSGGRGVFRRFKDALSADSRELERYYRFVEERNLVRILDWLESIDVKIVLVEG